MHVRDSTTLAYTKFRTRKIRSILVIVGSACITALILFFSIASAGLKNSVSGKATPFDARNLLAVQIAFTGPDPSSQARTNEEAYKSFVSETNLDTSHVKNTYFVASLYGQTGSHIDAFDEPNLTEHPESYQLTQLSAESSDLLAPYVATTQSLDVKDGVIPIVISTEFILQKYGTDITGIKDVQARVQKMTQLQQDYIGKEVKLTIKSQDPQKSIQGDQSEPKVVSVKARIVGFSPSQNGFLSSMLYGIVGQPAILTTFDAIAATNDLKSTDFIPQTVMLSYDTKQHRSDASKYLERYTGRYYASVYGDFSGPIQGIAESFGKIIKWVVVFMLIFVTLPMMSTMGKILADSQRETGVFRAIGARNRDIAQIYFVYSYILATLAFVLAVIIASVICLILTAKYGGILGAQLTELAGSANALHVILYGINIMHWAVLYALLVVSAGLGATIPVLRTLRKDPILAMRDE